MTITVSTDGSALGNPNGPMGWAWADHSNALGNASSHQHTGQYDAGGATNGTNQIGELCAVLEALRTHRGSEELVIETDSQYAINCATKWVHNWKRNGWKNAKKQPVKNADLVKAIDAELTTREGAVRFVWVKGHAGNAGNELVDELARTYATDCRSGAKEGYLPREGWQSLLASEYADERTRVPDAAQKLLQGTLSAQDYRVMHSENSHQPLFQTPSAEQPALHTQPATKTQSTAKQVSTTTQQVAAEQLSTATQSASIAQSSPNNTRSSGLHATGDIVITPPPSSSPHFSGERMHIQGTIIFDGFVDADGHLHLDGDVVLS